MLKNKIATAKSQFYSHGKTVLDAIDSFMPTSVKMGLTGTTDTLGRRCMCRERYYIRDIYWLCE